MKIFYPLLLSSFLLLSTSLFAQHQNALDFDGIDDMVIAPAGSSLIAGSNQFSLTMWVFPTNPAPSFPDFDGFAGIRNNVDADFYILQLTADSVEARFRNSNGANFDIISGGLVLNDWNHFVFTFDGTKLRLYFNGHLADSTLASGGITSTTEDFYIGNMLYGATDYLLTGKMDEVSLWNKALSASEVSCIHSSGINPTAIGLRAYYTFNQGTGGGINTSITTLQDMTGTIDGNLSGFALNGNSSNFVNGTLTYPVVSATLCPGGTYQFGSQTLSAAGSYMNGYPTAGCDSVVQLILEEGLLNLGVTIHNETMTSDQSGASYQWIDCDNGNAPVPNETGQSFTPSINGNYAVIVTSGSCGDTSLCYSMLSVGIQNLKNSNQVNVFPNPFENNLTLDIQGLTNDARITITGIHGETVLFFKTEGKNQIDIPTTSWAAGVYILKIETENGISVRRIVKL